MAIQDALRTDEVDVAAEIVATSAAPTVARFSEALQIALGGGFGAVRVVVSTWDSLLNGALDATEGIIDVPADRIDRPKDWRYSMLRLAVADAPFSSFVGAFGPGLGMALTCIARVRVAVPGLSPLVEPPAHTAQFATSVDPDRYHRLTDLALRGMAPPLERLQDALGLSQTELAAMFSVSRQAIDQWKERGIPASRRARVADAVAVVDLLERKLKPGRLPLVARRPAAGFGGRSLLEILVSAEHESVREMVERSFDWSTAA